MFTIFELVSAGKLTTNINLSPHSIDVSLGVICHEDRNCISTVSSLLVRASQSNTPIKRVECRDCSCSCLQDLITLFEILSTSSSLISVRIPPYSIDLITRSISYIDMIQSNDVSSLLTALQSKIPIKRVECRGSSLDSNDDIIRLLQIISVSKSVIFTDLHPHQVDVDKGVLLFRPYKIIQMNTTTVSALKCFFQCFIMKALTLTRFRFSNDTITSLCDLIKTNTSLTSVDFSECGLSDVALSQIIQALNIGSSALSSINFGSNSMGVKSTLALSEALKQNSSPNYDCFTVQFY
ncbi:hypothetical protein GEMRC1_009491 [Eukaryota sp. GEM-RC1]